MSDIIRLGWYYNTSTHSIPVGDNLLHPHQKIHSQNDAFKLIDIRYVYNGYLVYEAYVPFSSLESYETFGEPVKFNLEKSNKVDILEPKIEDIPEVPVINLNEGTSKEEIEKIPEVILSIEDIKSDVIESEKEQSIITEVPVVEEKPKIKKTKKK